MAGYRTKEQELEEEVRLLLAEIESINALHKAEVTSIKASARKSVLSEVIDRLAANNDGTGSWRRAMELVSLDTVH